eukprot:scaffold2353_cov181-Ochromonas_danica.AAC.1
MMILMINKQADEENVDDHDCREGDEAIWICTEKSHDTWNRKIVNMFIMKDMMTGSMVLPLVSISVDVA